MIIRHKTLTLQKLTIKSSERDNLESSILFECYDKIRIGPNLFVTLFSNDVEFLFMRQHISLHTFFKTNHFH